MIKFKLLHPFFLLIIFNLLLQLKTINLLILINLPDIDIFLLTTTLMYLLICNIGSQLSCGYGYYSITAILLIVVLIHLDT